MDDNIDRVLDWAECGVYHNYKADAITKRLEIIEQVRKYIKKLESEIEK